MGLPGLIDLRISIFGFAGPTCGAFIGSTEVLLSFPPGARACFLHAKGVFAVAFASSLCCVRQSGRFAAKLCMHSNAARVVTEPRAPNVHTISPYLPVRTMLTERDYDILRSSMHSVFERKVTFSSVLSLCRCRYLATRAALQLELFSTFFLKITIRRSVSWLQRFSADAVCR